MSSWIRKFTDKKGIADLLAGVDHINARARSMRNENFPEENIKRMIQQESEKLKGKIALSYFTRVEEIKAKNATLKEKYEKDFFENSQSRLKFDLFKTQVEGMSKADLETIAEDPSNLLPWQVDCIKSRLARNQETSLLSAFNHNCKQANVITPWIDPEEMKELNNIQNVEYGEMLLDDQKFSIDAVIKDELNPNTPQNTSKTDDYSVEMNEV